MPGSTSPRQGVTTTGPRGHQLLDQLRLREGQPGQRHRHRGGAAEASERYGGVYPGPARPGPGRATSIQSGSSATCQAPVAARAAVNALGQLAAASSPPRRPAPADPARPTRPARHRRSGPSPGSPRSKVRSTTSPRPSSSTNRKRPGRSASVGYGDQTGVQGRGQRAEVGQPAEQPGQRRGDDVADPFVARGRQHPGAVISSTKAAGSGSGSPRSCSPARDVSCRMPLPYEVASSVEAAQGSRRRDPAARAAGDRTIAPSSARWGRRTPGHASAARTRTS